MATLQEQRKDYSWDDAPHFLTQRLRFGLFTSIPSWSTAVDTLLGHQGDPSQYLSDKVPVNPDFPGYEAKDLLAGLINGAIDVYKQGTVWFDIQKQLHQKAAFALSSAMLWEYRANNYVNYDQRESLLTQSFWFPATVSGIIEKLDGQISQQGELVIKIDAALQTSLIQGHISKDEYSWIREEMLTELILKIAYSAESPVQDFNEWLIRMKNFDFEFTQNENHRVVRNITERILENPTDFPRAEEYLNIIANYYYLQAERDDSALTHYLVLLDRTDGMLYQNLSLAIAPFFEQRTQKMKKFIKGNIQSEDPEKRKAAATVLRFTYNSFSPKELRSLMKTALSDLDPEVQIRAVKSAAISTSSEDIDTDVRSILRGAILGTIEKSEQKARIFSELFSVCDPYFGIALFSCLTQSHAYALDRKEKNMVLDGISIAMDTWIDEGSLKKYALRWKALLDSVSLPEGYKTMLEDKLKVAVTQ